MTDQTKLKLTKGLMEMLFDPSIIDKKDRL